MYYSIAVTSTAAVPRVGSKSPGLLVNISSEAEGRITQHTGEPSTCQSSLLWASVWHGRKSENSLTAHNLVIWLHEGWLGVSTLYPVGAFDFCTMVAITKYLTLDGWKNRNLFFSQFWGLKV